MNTAAYYRAMCEMSQQMNSTLADRQVLDAIVECVARALDVKASSIMLLSADHKQLVHNAAWGLSQRYLQKGPVGTDVMVSILAEGRPVAIIDVTHDIRIHYRSQAVTEGISSIAVMPIWIKGSVAGVVAVYSAGRREFTSEEFDFLGAVANLAAVILERTGHVAPHHQAVY